MHAKFNLHWSSLADDAKIVSKSEKMNAFIITQIDKIVKQKPKTEELKAMGTLEGVRQSIKL